MKSRGCKGLFYSNQFYLVLGVSLLLFNFYLLFNSQTDTTAQQRSANRQKTIRVVLPEGPTKPRAGKTVGEDRDDAGQAEQAEQAWLQGQAGQAGEDLDWGLILHFVPDRNVKICGGLFTTASSLKRYQSRSYMGYKTGMAKFNAALVKLRGRGVNITMNPRPDAITALTCQELARQLWVRTVCDIGFNVNHNVLNWLVVREGITVHVFDTGERADVIPMAMMYKEMYGARFHLHIGDPSITLPIFIHTAGAICDILALSGNYDYTGVMKNNYNLIKAASKTNIVIEDNYYKTMVRRAFTNLIQTELLEEQYRCMDSETQRSFIIGNYNTRLAFT